MQKNRINIASNTPTTAWIDSWDIIANGIGTRACRNASRIDYEVSPNEDRRQGVQRTWEDVIKGHAELKRVRLEMQPVELLRRAVRRILGASSYQVARARWAAFHRHPLRSRKAHQQIIDYITPRWRHLTVHYHHHGMPATNNIAENTMRQLERRLKTIEGFGHVESAKGYVNLLIAYLRTKPFTDCRGLRRHRNGLSRMELAGAQLPTKDWLKLCLKP